MMKRLLLVSGLLMLGLCLSSCNRPTSSTPCTPADLEPPTLTSPGLYTNVGTAPTIGSLTPGLFQWEFDPDCTPEHFKLKFSPDRHFGIARAGMTDGELTWPPTGATYPQGPLEPATEYFWNVRAWTDGVNGPDSSTRVFFTGPLCTSASEMGAPELLSPDPGEVIHELYAELHYQVGEPKCLPEGYLVDLQTDSSFSGTNLLTEFGTPGTYVLTDELTDCTTYYWRVASLYGGVPGPFSETRAFNVAVGPACVVPAIDVDWLSDLEVLWPPEMPCDPYHVPPPEPIYPPPYSSIGEAATIGSIPDGLLQWDIGCQPAGFKLRFSTDQFFETARTGETDGERSWPVPGEPAEPPLEPGSQYFWNVNGYGIATGPTSWTSSFFTGPECPDTSKLVAPELVEPPDGAEITDRNVDLHYVTGEPKCLPDGYFIDLQTVPDFSDTSLILEYSVPVTYILTRVEDCTTYYWRVAAIQDGVYSPFSEVRTFATNLEGLCGLAIEELPYARATRDLPCLQGPDPSLYPTMGYLLAGESAPIVALSMDRQWWYIDNPDGTDFCAVPQDNTESEGDTSELPHWSNPELDQDETEGDGGPSGCHAGLLFNECIAAGGSPSCNYSVNPPACTCICP
jgi:hypothetical protein